MVAILGWLAVSFTRGPLLRSVGNDATAELPLSDRSVALLSKEPRSRNI
ncbi:hypothetical protein [Azospirillum canadense]|nr:hypothetical protein [Azospirillum canadense]MCW2236826.1 hypothetical protein [Azospirillum canadense]